MKKINILIVLFLVNYVTFAQFPLNFGITNIGWDYSYRPPVGSVCSSPTNSSGSWTTPNYTKAGEWALTSNALPIGYLSPGPGGVYGGISINAPLNFVAAANPTTLYIRKTITLPLALPRSAYTTFSLKIKADDGVRIYFNGSEVANHNLPTGSINAGTSAICKGVDITDYTFTIPNTFPIHPSDPDKITITAEIHQCTPTATTTTFGSDACLVSSSDLFFDCELTGTLGSVTPLITRGPYLQLPQPAGMEVRWSTNTSELGKVCYRTTSPITALGVTSCVAETIASTEHSVRLTGLADNTKYFYSIENANPLFLEGTANHYFTTPPTAVDNTKTTRIWVTGDCSETTTPSFTSMYTPKQSQVNAGFQAFKTANSLPAADLWLLLGDNAYDNGTNTEYSTKFFDPYDALTSNVMKQTPIMPCVGNHDYYGGGNVPGYGPTHPIDINNQLVPGGTLDVMNFLGGSSNSLFRQNKNNPFFSVFSMPANGGKYSTSTSIPGKKGFYSYNHNNIHFVALDSYGFYNDYILYGGAPSFPSVVTTNPQLTWLISDLNAAKLDPNVKWTIMYWHHSPYTNGGGHFSDDETADEFILKGIRENVIKYLDDANYKIDLVLNGHSHSYERSKLLKNHHYQENTFIPAVNNNPGLITGFNSNASSNGKFTSSTTCPYIKSSINSVNEGTIYVVTGSAGQIQVKNNAPDFVDFHIGHNALNGAYFRPNSTIPFPDKNGTGFVNKEIRSTIEDSKGGSFYIEVKGNRLDAKFVEEITGNVTDNFTIMKDVSTTTPIVKGISVLDFPSQTPDLQILPTPVNWPGITSFTLTAPSALPIPFTGTVLTPNVGPIYKINDPTGCLTQDYRFHFTPDCWPNTGTITSPSVLTINNYIDSPVSELIRSNGIIEAFNTISSTSTVEYQSVRSVKLSYIPPSIPLTPSPFKFFAQTPTPTLTMPHPYFLANIISTCP